MNHVDRQDPNFKSDDEALSSVDDKYEVEVGEKRVELETEACRKTN